MVFISRLLLVPFLLQLLINAKAHVPDLALPFPVCAFASVVPWWWDFDGSAACIYCAR